MPTRSFALVTATGSAARYQEFFYNFFLEFLGSDDDPHFCFRSRGGEKV